MRRIEQTTWAVTLPVAALAATITAALFAATADDGFEVASAWIMALGAAFGLISAAVAFSQSRRIRMLNAANKRVFLIHAHEDAGWANRIKQALTEAEISVSDAGSDILAGENWRMRIEEMLKESSLAIALISKNANDSPWVAKELEVFLNNKHALKGRIGPVLPVVIGNASLPRQLRSVQAIGVDEDFDKLIQSVKSAFDDSAEVEAEASLH